MVRLFRLAAIAACIFMIDNPASAINPPTTFTSLTVFGDSLVDSGNSFTATNGALPSVSNGYFKGRWMNGYNYVDLISQNLFGKPTSPSLLGGNNFAMGGAKIIGNGSSVPDLPAQIKQYTTRLTTTGGKVDPKGLYVLNFGGNDIFGAMNKDYSGFSSEAEYLTRAAVNYVQAVQTLNDLGARNIIITDFPVAYSPDNGIAEGIFYTALTTLHLAKTTKLYKFSYTLTFLQVATVPDTLGLPEENVFVSCQQANALASACAGYFSFDGTHPTAAVENAIFAQFSGRLGLAQH